MTAQNPTTPEKPDVTSSDSPAAPSSKPLTFDQAVSAHFHEAIFHALQTHPELRSVAVALDYEGTLNEAVLHKGVWLGRRGSVTRLDELVGSLQQGLELLQFQINRLAYIGQQYAQQAAAAAQELATATEKLSAQDQAIAERHADAA